MKTKYMLLIGFFVSSISFSNQKVVLSHENDDGIKKVSISDGDTIEVIVKDTCDLFAISYSGVKDIDAQIESSKKSVRSAIESNADKKNTCSEAVDEALKNLDAFCYKKDKQIFIPFNQEYSGYQVKLTSAESSDLPIKILDFEEGAICKGNPNEETFKKEIDSKITKAKPIKEKTFILIKKDEPWKVDYSAGIVVSQLVNPNYYIESVTNAGTTQKFIAENKSAEDDSRLVFGAFAHVKNREWGWGAPAFSAGVGTNSGTDLDYFLGLSWEFGPAYATLGNHWGRVNRLKNHAKVGSLVDGTTIAEDIVSDTNLTKKTDSAVFLSLTYTFSSGAQANFMKGIAPAPEVKK